VNRPADLARTPGRGRAWTVVIILLVTAHAALLVWVAAHALAVERANYAPWGFVWVAGGTLAIGAAAVMSARLHAATMVTGVAALASAVLLTPSAVAVLLLCLLSAYVLGLRILRFQRTDVDSVLPWTIPLLIGLCVWIGLVGAAAGLKMHFAPVYAFLLLAPLGLAWRDVRSTADKLWLAASTPRTHSRTELAWLVLALVVYVVHVFLVARPEVSYDASTMHLQIAALMAEEHRFRFDATRYAWALMPLGADWAYSVAYMLAGETAARGANLAFATILCAVVFQLARRHSSREMALASVVLMASTPLAFAETSSLYIENLWTAFLMASLLVALEFRLHRVTGAGALPVLALLAAGAMQCKVIGAIWLAPLLLAVLWYARHASSPRLPRARGVLVMMLAAVLGLWPYANAWLRSGNPVFPFMNTVFRSPLASTTESFDNPLYRAPLLPWSPYEIVVQSHRFIEGVDGAAGFHWLLLMPLVLVLLIRRRVGEHWLCAGLGAAFFVGVFTQQAYLRYLYPAFALLAVLGAWALSEFGNRRVTRIAVLVAGGILCGLHVRLVYTANWTTSQLCIGCAFDRHSRDAFTAYYMPDRRVAEYLNGNLHDARVGFLMLHGPSPAGFTGYSRSSNWHDTRFYWRVAAAATVEDIEALVREFKLTHIVYRTSRPDLETPVIIEFREKRSKPVWRFQDYVVAVLDPPS